MKDAGYAGYLRFFSNKKETVVSISTVLYVIMSGSNAEIHTSGGTVYRTRKKFSEIEESLGENFIKIHRGCVVSAMAIHEITDKIYLNNGASLVFAQRKKKEIIKKLHEIQKSVIDSFHRDGIPATAEEY